MQGKVYVGIDWGSERHAICATDATGRVIVETFVGADTTALDVIARLSGEADRAEVFIGIETRRLALVDVLLANNYRVFTINPKQLDRFRDRYSPAGAKDDSLDARVACSALRTDFGAFHEAKPEPAELVRLRSATRIREVLGKNFRASANRLREIVFLAMPLLVTLCEGADEPWFWDLVNRVLASTTKQLLTDGEIATILKLRRITRLSVADIRTVLDRPHLPSGTSLRSGAAWQAELVIEELTLLRKQMRKVDKEILVAQAALPETSSVKKDMEILMTLPGFGEVVTPIFVVEAADELGTRDLQRLRRLTGAAPVRRATGKKQRKKIYTVQMRRAANARLRNALYWAANTAVQRDTHFGAIYKQQRAKGHQHARALRTVGDRMLTVLIAMLRTGTEYKPPSA